MEKFPFPQDVYVAKPMSGPFSGLFTISNGVQQVAQQIKTEPVAQLFAAALTSGLKVNPNNPARAVRAYPVLVDAAVQVLKWVDAGCDPSEKSIVNLRRALAESMTST